MKRHRKKTPQRPTRDAERLIALSNGAAAAGSHLERIQWERDIEALCVRLVESGNHASIENALDHTFQSNLPAHDVLSALTEASAESATITVADQKWNVLLLALPMVAWSKYSVPSGALSASADAAFSALVPHLCAHILSANARLALVPWLYSMDTGPRDFSSVRKLTLRLGAAAIAGKAVQAELGKQTDTAPLLADTRFLLGAVAVPQGEALFRWQETDPGHSPHSECLERWIQQARPSLAKLLSGCSFECLLPNAYFASVRDADYAVRPLALRAATAFLESLLNLNASELRAVVAGVGETRVDEYRIAFMRKGEDDVLEGVIWPLYGSEDEDSDPAPLAAITHTLAECNITDVIVLPGLFAPEFCDDCGAPLMPDPDGAMLHPELPEEVEPTVTHYH